MKYTFIFLFNKLLGPIAKTTVSTSLISLPFVFKLFFCPIFLTQVQVCLLLSASVCPSYCWGFTFVVVGC